MWTVANNDEQSTPLCLPSVESDKREEEVASKKQEE
jgi:hypothetical protein